MEKETASAAIRLLAVDVDGTLVVRDNEITPATRAALHRAAAAGIVVVIATGRRWRTTRRAVDALELAAPIVCSGGALVKSAAGHTVHARAFSAEGFQQIARAVRTREHTIVCQRDSSVHGGADFVIDGTANWNGPTASYYETNAEWAESVEELPEHPRDDILVVGTFGARDELEALERALQASAPGTWDTSVVGGGSNGSAYLDIKLAEVTKWSGLKALAGHLGIATNAICAVGDEHNDLSMIRAAALGVAMGNAADAVKAEADWVTGRNDEDGLVAVVDRVLGAGA